jgi:hypothetical protein
MKVLRGKLYFVFSIAIIGPLSPPTFTRSINHSYVRWLSCLPVKSEQERGKKRSGGGFLPLYPLKRR